MINNFKLTIYRIKMKFLKINNKNQKMIQIKKIKIY